MSLQENPPEGVLFSIPKDLPVPVDDGACAHLEGLELPVIQLPSTSGNQVNIVQISGWLVVFCYPMTGRPGRKIPDGWSSIPGAAGCTPEACSFRDHYVELQQMSVTVFGLSTQATEDQAEAVDRLHLPFALLSDSSFQFSQALGLPMLVVANLRLTKRLTLVAKNGVIKKCFYPVFPPDENVEHVLQWLAAHGT